MASENQTTDGWVRIPHQPGDPQPRISDGHYRGIRIDEVGDFWGLPRPPRVRLEDLAVQLAAVTQSAGRGYYATARAEMNGARLILDEMERANAG